MRVIPNSECQSIHLIQSCCERVALANFLSILQLAIPSSLFTLPHKHAAVITMHGSKQEDPALSAQEITGLPLYGVLCPDWIKLAGIPQHVFSLLLHEAGPGES